MTGHILLSKHVAEDLEEYERWRPLLHDLGSCEVKHGMRVSVVNLYDDQFGNGEAAAEIRDRAETPEASALGGNDGSTAGARGNCRRCRNVFPQSREIGAGLRRIKASPYSRLKNRSGDPNNAYFADGIQDEILTLLSRIADLKVISRTSTLHYKSASRNLRESPSNLA